MRSQEMINYKEMAYARPTFNIFKSDFLFLSTILDLLEHKMKRKNAKE